MSIQFQCQGCASPFAVPETMAGSKARCNRCGAIVTVPKTSVGPAVAPLKDPLQSAHSPAMQSPAMQSPLMQPHMPAAGANPGYTLPPAVAAQGSKMWLWLALGGGGAALLLLVMVMVGTMLARSVRIPDLTKNPIQLPPVPSINSIPGTGPSRNGTGLVGGPASRGMPRPSRAIPATSVAANFNSSASSDDDTSPFEPDESSSSSGSHSVGTPLSASGLPGIPERASFGKRSTAGDPSGNGSVLPSGAVDVTEAAEAAAAPPEIYWQAKIDPPPQPLEYKKGKIAVPFDTYSTKIKVPTGPSNFILVTGGYGKDQVWQVLDLRTAKQIGQTILPGEDAVGYDLTFSPDGRYAAAELRNRGSRTIGVWSFATGQKVQEISPSDIFSELEVTFGDTHHLVMSYKPDYNRTAVGDWNLQTGEKVQEMSFSNDNSERLARDSLACSPGGKYLVLITGDKLGVIEMATGQAVGQVQLPAGFSTCNCISFSPDGTELALDVRCSSRDRLVFIEFATGKLRLDRELESSYIYYEGSTIEWMPDKSSVLYKGHLLVDAVTGDGVWFFPRTDSSPRKMLRPGEMLVVLSGGRGGRVLQTVDLPQKEITTGLESVRAGGEAIDVLLPPLTTPDLFSALPVTLPNGFTPWAAQMDSAGPVAKGLDRELMVAKEGESLKRVIFAGVTSGKLVVQKEVQQILGVGGGRRGQRRMVIERYDVASGSKGTSIEIPPVYHLVGVSPSGNHALVGYADSRSKADRIDVISLAPKKHIAGWRPYIGDALDKTASSASAAGSASSSIRDSTSAIRWLSMVDDEHVITVSASGKLVNWKLPECKASYYFEQFGQPLALSPGRQFLAGVHNGEFRLFETATGNCVGDLESPATGIHAIRACFRPDGQELAAIIDGGEDKMLVRWNLSTGKIEQEFPIPGEMVTGWKRLFAILFGDRSDLEYRGNGHLLLDNTYLLDLQQRAVVWRYELDGAYISGSPDDKTWYCTRRERSYNSPVFLTTYETPSKHVEGKTAGISLESQLVLYPGMSVRLIVDLTGVNMQHAEPTVNKALRESLENRGILVSDTAPMTLSVLTGERSTGDVIGVSSAAGYGYSPFFRRSAEPDQILSKQQLVCRFALTDNSGRVRWFRDRTVTMRSYGYVEAGNAEEQLRKEMYSGFTNVLASTAAGSSGLPTYFFSSLNEMIGGESQLIFGGERPIVRMGDHNADASGASPSVAPQ